MAGLAMLACAPKTITDDALLDTVECATIKYFTDFADPGTGLARERNNDQNGNIVTIGGSGFGMMAVIAGAEREYYPRQEWVDEAIAEWSPVLCTLLLPGNGPPWT